MLDGIVTAVVALLLPGLFILAYKDHAAYKRIAPWLALVLILLLMTTTIVNLAIVNSREQSGEVAKSADISQLEGLIESQGWLTLGVVALLAYMTFLYYLPRILGKDKAP